MASLGGISSVEIRQQGMGSQEVFNTSGNTYVLAALLLATAL